MIKAKETKKRKKIPWDELNSTTCATVVKAEELIRENHPNFRMKKKTKAIKHKNDEISSYVTYGCKLDPNQKQFGPCHARIDIIESIPIQDQVPYLQSKLR